MIEKDRHANMHDVARMAGVSQATVSRVINNSGYFSDKVKNRVLRAIKQLNYEPNPTARRLVLKLTENIGVVMSEPLTSILHNPYYTQILHGLLEVVENTHYNLSLGSINLSPQGEYTLPLFLRRKDVDAILILGVISEHNLDKIRTLGQPFLLIDNHMLHDGTPAVENDDFGAAYMATKYLINKGHRNIAFIGLANSHPLGIETWKGFKKALEEFNISIHPTHIQEGDLSKESGSISMEKIYRASIKPSAVFVSNDYMAAGALDFLNKLGISVPNEIAIIGSDDLEISNFTNPPLTTVHTNTFLIGKKAAEIMMEIIKNTYNGPIKTLIPNYLIVRESA